MSRRDVKSWVVTGLARVWPGCCCCCCCCCFLPGFYRVFIEFHSLANDDVWRWWNWAPRELVRWKARKKNKTKTAAFSLRRAPAASFFFFFFFFSFSCFFLLFLSLFFPFDFFRSMMPSFPLIRRCHVFFTEFLPSFWAIYFHLLVCCALLVRTRSLFGRFQEVQDVRNDRNWAVLFLKDVIPWLFFYFNSSIGWSSRFPPG